MEHRKFGESKADGSTAGRGKDYFSNGYGPLAVYFIIQAGMVVHQWTIIDVLPSPDCRIVNIMYSLEG